MKHRLRFLLTWLLLTALPLSAEQKVNFADLPTLTTAASNDGFTIYDNNGSGVYTVKRITFGELQTSLSLQPLDSDLTAIAALTTATFGRSLLTESSASTLKTTLSLGNVENTALSTWAGSSNVTTLGTVTTGTLSTGVTIGDVTMNLTGTDATGDIYYRGSDGILKRLAIGTSGQVLSVSGGLPAWAAASGGGTWGSITGTLSAQTDLNTALGGKLVASSNLSDLASAATARTNLGLGTAATKTAGAAAGQVPLYSASPIIGTSEILVHDSNGDLGRRSTSQFITDTGLLTEAAAGTQFLSAETTLFDLTGLTDPNADRILFWDDSAGAYAHLTVGSGLSITGTTLTATGSGAGDLLAANNLSDVANPATARTNLGLAIGTNVQAYHANLAALAGLPDPNSDRLPFWDDSAGTITWLTPSTGLTITDTSLTVDNTVVRTVSTYDNPDWINTLSATKLTSGTLSDARLSGNVTLLGSSISLTSEVAGTLPVANGGTGVTTPSLVAGTGVAITGTWPNQTVAATGSATLPTIDVRSGGVAAANSAATNKAALQALIDANTDAGAILSMTEPVACDAGLVLKNNVHIVGNNLAAFKGPGPLGGGATGFTETPAGAAFIITNTTDPFIRMNSNTSIDGVVFHYPNQAFQTTTPGASLITYPATIVKEQTNIVEGISLRRLQFTGATACIDLSGGAISSDFEIDLCYGYPLGGPFVKMDDVLDIPRISRCHVNPGAGTMFLGSGGNGLPYTNEIIDWVAASGAPTFDIDHCDEVMVSQCFVFGVNTGFRLNDTYGSLIQCQADQVETGFLVNLGTGYKYLTLVSCNVIPGGGTLADRNAVLFEGAGGTLICIGLSGFTSTASPVPSSGTPGANSLVKVAGSGAQRLMLTHPRTNSAAGSWAKFIDQTNASAVVTYSDSAQGSVTTASLDANLKAVQVEELQLAAATTSIVDVTTETAEKLIPIKVGTTTYWVLASTSAGGFLPTDITGCVLWLDANQGAYTDAGTTLATNGQTVRQWNDQSGAGHNVSQATSGNRPTWIASGVNSKPVLDFDGTTDFMTSGAFTATQPTTVFIVFALDTTTTAYSPIPLDGIDGTDRNVIYVSDPANSYLTMFGTSNLPSSSTLATGTYIVAAAKFDGASSLLRRNGTQIVSGNAGTAQIGGVTIGSDYAQTTANFLDGKIAEIIIYDAALSTPEIEQVEAYLTVKYGL